MGPRPGRFGTAQTQYFGRYPHVPHRSPPIGAGGGPPKLRLILLDPAELLSAIFKRRPSTSYFLPDCSISLAIISGKVTKPNPRDFPDSRSAGM